MAVATMGVSTLGITFGYGVEATAGTKPTKFDQLDRISTIGGITIENEQIDSSALEDFVSSYVRGRADTGGTFHVTVNFTPETQKQWQKVITDYNALTGGKRMWFETIIPGFTDSFFVIAQPPSVLPQPEFNQKELLVMEINLTIVDYRGMEASVALSGGE